MSSGTSTRSHDEVRLKPDPSEGAGLQPWQLFVLAALACATAATFLARGQGPTRVILLSVLVGAAAPDAPARGRRRLPRHDRARAGQPTGGGGRAASSGGRARLCAVRRTKRRRREVLQELRGKAVSACGDAVTGSATPHGDGRRNRRARALGLLCVACVCLGARARLAAQPDAQQVASGGGPPAAHPAPGAG